MAVVETRAARKVYVGDTAAVDGVDLRTKEGEYLVLLGPSGSGKTTLLRMIAGLERLTGGQVLIGGRVVNDLPPRARRIAMVFQSYALYPHKTVEANIAFPLAAAGMPKEERPQRIRWAASLLGIDHLLARKPRQLSGGERQRVALARALVAGPSLLLADEPAGDMDPEEGAHLLLLLREIAHEDGVTVVLFTRDIDDAAGVADQIVSLDGGCVVAAAAPLAA